MIRKLIIATIVVNFVFILASVFTTRDSMLPSSFANTTIGGGARAHVDGVLELVSGGIRQLPWNAPSDANPWLYPNSTEFNFGDLRYQSVEGYYIGSNYYVTLMVPVTSGRKFKITETGTALTGANGTIPDNGFLQIPDYQFLDELPEGTPQNAMPTNAYCALPSSAVGTHDVYVDNGPSAQSRIVRGIIAISGPPLGETYPINYRKGHNGAVGMPPKQEFTAWVPVDANQQPGDYAGSVTFTLNLI